MSDKKTKGNEMKGLILIRLILTGLDFKSMKPNSNLIFDLHTNISDTYLI